MCKPVGDTERSALQDALRKVSVFSLLGVLGRPRQSPLVRMQTQDRAAAAASVRRLLDWPIQRVAPAHGAILEGDGVQGTVAEVLDTMAGWGAA